MIEIRIASASRPRRLGIFSFMAIVGAMVVGFASSAEAGGLFDALFGGFGGFAVPNRAPTYTYSDPSADVRSEGGKAFCVRLCDGRYYPIISGGSNSTPVQMCSAMCPAAKTKVFNGGEIATAMDSTGVRYSKLDQAFAYRKSVVPGCTCNGKDAFGLVNVDIASDPTLRAGDMVATADGLKPVGRKSMEFAPPSKVSGALRERISDLRAPEKQ
jgi:hypothetical protein